MVSLSNSFFIQMLNLFQILFYFLSNSSSPISKYLYLLQPSYFFTSALDFWKKYIEWFNFIINYVTHKLVIIFLTWKNFFFSISLSTNVRISLPIFYTRQRKLIFYNVPLFLVKVAFLTKFIVSSLLSHTKNEFHNHFL